MFHESVRSSKRNLKAKNVLNNSRATKRSERMKGNLVVDKSSGSSDSASEYLQDCNRGVTFGGSSLKNLLSRTNS